jgi:hypothetical protein
MPFSPKHSKGYIHLLGPTNFYHTYLPPGSTHSGLPFIPPPALGPLALSATLLSQGLFVIRKIPAPVSPTETAFPYQRESTSSLSQPDPLYHLIHISFSSQQFSSSKLLFYCWTENLRKSTLLQNLVHCCDLFYFTFLIFLNVYTYKFM